MYGGAAGVGALDFQLQLIPSGNGDFGVQGQGLVLNPGPRPGPRMTLSFFGAKCQSVRHVSSLNLNVIPVPAASTTGQACICLNL